MLHCKAIVIRCSPRYVWLKTVPQHLCHGCKQHVSCSKTKRIFKIPTKQDKKYTVGEWITISINEEKAVEINLLIFGVPLLLLFLMMIIMVSFFPLVTDWQLSQIVLINVVLGFILAKLLIKRRANQFKYWYLEEEEEKS